MRLVYTGSPGRSKDRLVELVVAVGLANASGARVTLTLAGLTDDEWAQVTRKAGPRFRPEMGECVHAGRVDAHRVPRILSEHDFSVLVRRASPHSLAGFPTKVVESCASARPALLSPIGDIAGFLADDRSAIFLKGDGVEEIREGLLRAAALTSDAKRTMGENARAAVFPALSQERFSPGLWQFVENVSRRSVRSNDPLRVSAS